MMTPSTIDMTDLEDAIDDKLDAQDAEACGASGGEIHEPEEAEQEGEAEGDASEQNQSAQASDSDQDLLAKIREQEQLVAACEDRLTDAKEEVKECRERFDVEVAKLRGLIRGSQEKHPLFDESSPIATESLSHKNDGKLADWRDVEISALNVPDSLATKLYESSIETIGDLVDWQSVGKTLTDIKGVGQSKADKIADALEEFWRANSQYTR